MQHPATHHIKPRVLAFPRLEIQINISTQIVTSTLVSQDLLRADFQEFRV